jgi:hypothetical protein
VLNLTRGVRLHSQLRDLVHSPRQRGLVYTVQGKSILQYDLRNSKVSPSPHTPGAFEGADKMIGVSAALAQSHRFTNGK